MRLVGYASVLALLSGCMVDLSIPAGAELTCAGDIECPAGFACSKSLLICVTATTGPAALSPTIDPEWANAGGLVRAEFTSNGRLSSQPTVELQTSPARAFAFVEKVDDRYAFSYTVVGDEGEAAVAITATLSDADGATATSALGQVTFDFTAPTGSGARNGNTFGSGDKLSQSLGASETLGEHPSIVVASTPAVPLTLLTHDGTSYGFEHTFDGTEPSGTFAVIATLRDRAGNPGTVDLGTVTVNP